MRVWQINTADISPADKGVVRLGRSGLLAQALVDRGHDLLWWSADFFHAARTHRHGRDSTVTLGERYRIRYIHGPGYRRSLSFARLIDHRIVAKRFARQAMQEQRPDIVICSCPTLDLSLAAVRYGRAAGVPVVLDVRDLWPDIFLEAVPRLFRLPAAACLLPYYSMARRACAGATAIVGNAPAFVSWGLDKARRGPTELDRDFPFGYQKPALSVEEQASATRFWEEQGIDFGSGTPIVCYFGAISHASDFDMLVDAAKLVLRGRDALFVLCGGGDRLEHCRLKARDYPRILLPGWVSAGQLWVLMKNAYLGLTAFYDNDNFRNNLSNKPIEYFAGGLPVLSSIDRGYLAELLRANQCGLTYGGDAGRLTDAICRLIETPEEQAAMSSNARRLFEERFAADKVYAEFVRHLVTVAVKRSN